MQLDPDMSSRDRESFVMATNLAGTLEDDDPEIIAMYQDLTSGFDSMLDARGSDLVDIFNNGLITIQEDYIIFKEEDVSFGYYDGDGDQVSLDSGDRENYGAFEAGFNRLPQGSGVIVMDAVNGTAYLDEDLYYIHPNHLEFQIQRAINAANEYSRDHELAEDHWFELESENYMTSLMDAPLGEIYIPFDDNFTLEDYQTATQTLKIRNDILGISTLDPITKDDIDAVMQTKPF